MTVFFFFFFSYALVIIFFFFFFQAEDGIRDHCVTGVQTCALPIFGGDPAEVRLTVTAHDDEFKPLDNATVQLTVRPVGPASAENEKTNYVQLTAEPSATTPGTYEATYIARDAGAYSVEALVTQSDGKIAGKAAAGWTSDPAAEEFRSLKPNRALLETIAKRTGGEVVALVDLEKFVRRLPERHAPITETWTEPLW